LAHSEILIPACANETIKNGSPLVQVHDARRLSAESGITQGGVDRFGGLYWKASAVL
jgi:hypothetical protein